MTQAWWCMAPAKVNLCLYVGPTRADGRHELVTVMDSVSLHDTVALTPGEGQDEVICPGVDGPNLAGTALQAFRAETGWDGPPVRLTITKRIPVAGGMAGGSADAAAALRLVAAAAGVDDPELLERIAGPLGADVPSQVHGGRVLAEGAGERLTRHAVTEPRAVVVLPLDAQLSAGAVYSELDRAGEARTAEELAELRARVIAAEQGEGVLTAGLMANDLQAAAIRLCPQIATALDALQDAGAEHAFVSGSGPTVVGLFPSDVDWAPVLGELADWPEGISGARLLGADPAMRVPVPGEVREP
ncbi:MAG: 4-(cytidine 5'-diphospho)-2-C-methyl-D-erythritol kinase [Solirubrobacteraceae bacterium]|nr:4-(cytidine 5'-diphospho)-2-C-methyl-D-erythritol kinase [Solirubrobacteraceae bacterium]